VDEDRADEALEAWLVRALDSWEPVRAELMVVDPVVVVNVDEPLVTVETRSPVETAEEGILVTPATPLRPDSVVVPVTVKVEPLLVRVAVKVEVPRADEEPPKMVVEPVVEVMVESPLVMTVTRPEVVMAEDEAPPAPPTPPAPPDSDELSPALVVVTVVEATVAVVVVKPEVTVAQTPLPQETTLAAASLSGAQCWYAQS
jgi:hypothetical protein